MEQLPRFDEDCTHGGPPASFIASLQDELRALISVHAIGTPFEHTSLHLRQSPLRQHKTARALLGMGVDAYAQGDFLYSQQFMDLALLVASATQHGCTKLERDLRSDSPPPYVLEIRKVRQAIQSTAGLARELQIRIPCRCIEKQAELAGEWGSTKKKGNQQVAKKQWQKALVLYEAALQQLAPMRPTAVTCCHRCADWCMQRWCVL